MYQVVRAAMSVGGGSKLARNGFSSRQSSLVGAIPPPFKKILNETLDYGGFTLLLPPTAIPVLEM